jgi:hypothetical protein
MFPAMDMVNDASVKRMHIYKTPTQDACVIDALQPPTHPGRLECDCRLEDGREARDRPREVVAAAVATPRGAENHCPLGSAWK